MWHLCELGENESKSETEREREGGKTEEGGREREREREAGGEATIHVYISIYTCLISLITSDGKFAFQLVEPDQPAYTFIALSNSEKREWMSALTQLLTKSTFDRLLDAKLREEEKTIPILRPDSNKYM